MARPVRIEYEGAIYHVTSRGNERKKIFFGKADYEKFLYYMEEAKEKYDYVVHCYVLMTNHYHLVIQTPQGNLSEVMHFINGSYTNYINRKRGRQGHLFQGRYKAILVDGDTYLLEGSRYLHLNPVRAKLVGKPEEYPYSSYRSYVSGAREHLVSRDMIWEMISKDRRRARKGYRDFVERAIGTQEESPLKKIYGGAILGGHEFIKEALGKLEEGVVKREDVSHRRELQGVISSDVIIDAIASHFGISKDVVREDKRTYRKIAISLMKQHTATTNRQIMNLFGDVTYSAIAKIHERFREELIKDKSLREDVQRIRASLSNVKG